MCSLVILSTMLYPVIMSTLTRKIESRAVSEIKSIIAKHTTMEDFINDHDTGACFDGFIRIYLDDNNAKDKANLDYDIPVQIKGHEDKSGKYLKAVKIDWSVNLDDLRAYYRSNGCMYFVVMMDEGGGDYRVFYNSLYPSKVGNYLEVAQKKGNQESLTISFAPLPEKTEEVAFVMKQFAFEVRKQGSGCGQIVPNAIHIEDLGQIKSISVTSIGRNLLSSIKTGDAVFYGKKSGETVEYPLLIRPNSASSEERINKQISVGDKVFYNSFLFKRTVFPYESKKYQDDVFTIKLSDNVSLSRQGSDNLFQVKPTSTIDDFKTDAEFLIALSREGYLTIEGQTVLSGITISEESSKWLQWYIDVSATLDKIKCRIDTAIPYLTDKQIGQLNFLRCYSNWKVNGPSDFLLSVYDWEFGDKYYPILVKKNLTSGAIDIDEFVFDLKHHCCLREEGIGTTKTEYLGIVPNYFNRTPKVLANLLFYDYESMLEQINRSTISEFTVTTMNGLGLRLISAYDLCGNRRLLELASAVFSRLYSYNPSCVYFINSLQIDFRLNGRLSDEQVGELKAITKDGTDLSESEFSAFSFCRAVLLDDNTASNIYEQLSDENKEMLGEMPIMALYRKQTR